MKYRADRPYEFGSKQNESRADQAEAMLAVGTDREGEGDPADVAQDVQDALAHFIHFCVRAGLDFDELVVDAAMTHEGDLRDGPEAARDTERFPAVSHRPPPPDLKERLEYLRQELRAERISWGELNELQGLAEHIDPGDTELLEAAGVPEHAEEE